MRVDLDRLGGDLDVIADRAPDLADGLAEFRAMVAELEGWRAFAQDMADHGHQPKPDDPRRYCWICVGMGRMATLTGEPLAESAADSHVTPAHQQLERVVPSRAKRGHK